VPPADRLLDLRRGDVAAGNAVPLAVPGLYRGLGLVAVLEYPGLGLRHQLLEVADEVVDHARIQGLTGSTRLPSRRIGQRRLEAEELGQADHATPAGQQAEGDLGQADLHRAVVPGQRWLQARLSS
jgi:catechol 2,3-dioxygenase-like lactoylglutathione lyase family enzyme